MSDDGGPAFPAADMRIHGTYGMTLRDWFAGQALASVMGTAENMGQATTEERRMLWAQLSGILYEVADAMLAARKEPKA
jgi:hypothetical protein